MSRDTASQVITTKSYKFHWEGSLLQENKPSCSYHSCWHETELRPLLSVRRIRCDMAVRSTVMLVIGST